MHSNRGKERISPWYPCIKIQCDPSVPVSRNRLITGTRTAKERLTVSCVRSNRTPPLEQGGRKEKNPNKKFASACCPPLSLSIEEISSESVCLRDSLVLGLELGNGETVMKREEGRERGAKASRVGEYGTGEECVE